MGKGTNQEAIAVVQGVTMKTSTMGVDLGREGETHGLLRRAVWQNLVQSKREEGWHGCLA